MTKRLLLASSLFPVTHGSISLQLFLECRYFWRPRVSFVMRDEFSVRLTKIATRIGISWIHSLSVFNLFLTQWIMATLSKGYKQDNFEPHKSLKCSFTNIWGLHLNFVECEFLLESNSPDILALYVTNLDDSIDSGNFSVRGYLPLIWKYSVDSYAWSSSLCDRRISFYMGLISWNLNILHSVSSLSSINHFLCYAQFLILYHLT